MSLKFLEIWLTIPFQTHYFLTIKLYMAIFLFWKEYFLSHLQFTLLQFYSIESTQRDFENSNSSHNWPQLTRFGNTIKDACLKRQLLKISVVKGHQYSHRIGLRLITSQSKRPSYIAQTLCSSTFRSKKKCHKSLVNRL